MLGKESFRLFHYIGRRDLVPEKADYSLLTESPGRAAMDQSDASSMASFFRSADPQRMIQIPTMYYFTL